MVRVLIADDSQLTRMVIRDLLARDPGITIIGEACDGSQAVELTCQLKPDLVLLDVMMPVMDGLTAVMEIMARCPTPILILSGNVDPTDSRSAFNAIRHGALDVMEKPAGIATAAFGEIAVVLIDKIRSLAKIRVIHHYRRPRAPLPPVKSPVSHGRNLLAIGASTGGPKAVMSLVKSLPAACPMPVLIVQHIAQGFAAGFAEWLNRECAIQVRLASDGASLAAGVALVAPNEVQMEVQGGRVRLIDAPPVNCCRPSVDVLFRSLARDGLAPRLVAVLLTGMGQDGADGMAALKVAGSFNIAQDESSSAVFGMPRAAIQLNAVHQILPLAEIPPTINRLFAEGKTL
jgi:two-component system, chemotaxis family, protein-glutamate methylesterase/glutaminase